MVAPWSFDTEPVAVSLTEDLPCKYKLLNGFTAEVDRLTDGTTEEGTARVAVYDLEPIRVEPLYVLSVYVMVAEVALVHFGAKVAMAGVKLGVVELVELTAVPDEPPNDHVMVCVKLEDAREMVKVYAVPIVCEVLKDIEDALGMVVSGTVCEEVLP